MKLSAPVYELKSRAKKLKKQNQTSLYEAQDQIAQQEGYQSWSLLMSKQGDVLPESIVDLLDYLNPGDMALLAARPLLGKTTIAAGLISTASYRGGPMNHFFTLVEHESAVRNRVEGHLEQLGLAPSRVNVDCSDEICADYIIKQLSHLDPNQLHGTVVVVDYLQLLDERRETPPLQNQIESLNLFAKAAGCIVIFLAQLSRDVEKDPSKAPNEDDIRLPNPLDLKLFNKLLFLHKRMGSESKAETMLLIRKPHRHEFEVRLHRSVFALQSQSNMDQ